MKPKPKCPFYDKIFRRSQLALKGLAWLGTPVISPIYKVSSKNTCYKVCGTTRQYHPTCCMNCPKFLSCKLVKQGCPVSKQSRILKLCILNKGKDVNYYRENIVVVRRIRAG